MADFDQSKHPFDDSPRRFRSNNPQDKFAGASGVLFEQAMAQTRMAVCLVDPNGPDMPIIFANRAFRALTGYDESEIIGHNCRFLQGPETDPDAIARIRTALATEDVMVVEMINYRKDGSKFWNALHLGPVYNTEGELIYYFGSQWDVTDVHSARAEEIQAKLLARELSHRIKNLFSVISGIVSMTGRAAGAHELSAEINGRIHALGRAYDTTLDQASEGHIEVGQAIRSVLAGYDADSSRIHCHGNGARANSNVISALGLLLHELATNATKYGALSGESQGKVDVDWTVEQPDGEKAVLILEWTENGGPAVSGPPEKYGSGLKIADSLISYCNGTINRDWRPEGLYTRIGVPVEND